MPLDRDISDLARIPLFAALEYEARRLLAFSSETRILRGGDILIHKGAQSEGGFVLLNGSLEIEASAGSPSAKAISPFSLIGELALITQTENAASVVARAPSAVLKIPRALFLRVLKEHPRSARQVKSLIENRLTSYSSELGALARGSFSEIESANG